MTATTYPVTFAARCPCCPEVITWTARLSGPTPSLCSKAKAAIEQRVSWLMKAVA